MKILFIHLGRENLGIEFLSSMLKEAGHETKLACDIGLFSQNDNIFYSRKLESHFSLEKSIIKRFDEYKPDVVCMSAYTSSIQWCFSIAEQIKQISNIPVIIGGPHVTLAPESSMECTAIDYGVRGEAEYVINDIVEAAFMGEVPSDIAGAVWREDGEIKNNGAARLPVDLDALPLPDKQLFAHVVNFRDDYMTLTTRGCIFKCSYCCEEAMRNLYKGNRHRRVRSVGNVLDELNIMKERYYYHEVHFFCSLFPPDKEWVSVFSERYKKEIGKPFYCFSHINFFDLEYAKMMKHAGCRNIEFGLQTLNEDIRKKVLNRHEKNERLVEVLRICDEVGLHYDVDVIMQLPGESEQDYVDAIRTYAGCRNIHRAKIFNLTLFPGTGMLNYCKDNGYIDDEKYDMVMNGKTGDFFHVDFVESSIDPHRLKTYEKILRILPVFRESFILSLLEERKFARMGRIPGVMIKLLELFNLLKRRDLRMILYFKLYLKHFLLHFTFRRHA